MRVTLLERPSSWVIGFAAALVLAAGDPPVAPAPLNGAPHDTEGPTVAVLDSFTAGTPQAARLIGTNRDPGDFAVATLEPVGAVGSGLPGQALLAFSRLGAGSPVASLKSPPAVPGAEAHTPAGAPQAAGAAAMGPE
ncbi:MAG TPA: hypothetical protein VFK80_08365, partial [Limnochordia bacterium]|nr:hypothetical protein [Limnochordia bacterium]